MGGEIQKNEKSVQNDLARFETAEEERSEDEDFYSIKSFFLFFEMRGM